VQKAVGRNGHEAIAARKTQSEIHALRSSGVKVEDNAPQLTPGRKSLKEAARGYLYDTRAQHRPKTLAKYREALASFAAFTPKRYLDDLRADDNPRVHGAHADPTRAGTEDRPGEGRDRPRCPHWPRSNSAHEERRLAEGDKEDQPSVYRTDTLKRLLASVNREHYITYSFLLHTGFREQEATFCSWPDVNWERGEISVTEKLHLGFQIKNYERRTVPVVEELMELLREHRKTLPDDAFLVFPTRAAKGPCGSDQARREEPARPSGPAEA
jgi:integrase